jgi:hypothetical protein
MIKIITLITKFIVITLIALFFGSCNRMVGLKSIVGSGNVTTENRTVQGEFKSVEVSNALDLVIEQSNTTEIIIEADDNLQKEITTTVENGVLVIACEYNSFVNIKSKKVTVKMPVIEGLEASSAATIHSKNTLKGDHINLASSSAGTIRVSTEFETIESDSSSGSTTTISGKALNLEATASSGSIINATDLLANAVIADASSGGSIVVHPIVSLKADASSGSNINYTTVPKSIQKNSNSGATITKI